jgi:hypothetical protein
MLFFVELDKSASFKTVWVTNWAGVKNTANPPLGRNNPRQYEADYVTDDDHKDGVDVHRLRPEGINAGSVA